MYSKIDCPKVSGLKLLTTGSYKTAKSFKKGILTFILYLTPDTKLCPYASKGCMKACLYTSGMGGMSLVVQRARERKTLLFYSNQKEFLEILHSDIQKAIAFCKKRNLKCAIRLNGTSDILWERLIDMEQYPCQFYDYTKIPVRYRKNLPKNYHLTFSRSETNWNECIKALEKDINVAVVFKKLPKTYMGYKVIDGDKTDLRYLDPKSVIVGLKEKKDTRLLKYNTNKIRTEGFIISA